MDALKLRFNMNELKLFKLDSYNHVACIWIFRLSRYKQFKDFSKRMLVATNLFGRGMDIERVNIVFNYDMPEDSDTYLHRVCTFVSSKNSSF